MTQFATMLAALDFRDAVASGNDDEIMTYIHNLAVQGGQLLAQEWNTELLLPTDSFGAMVDVRVPCTNKTLMSDLFTQAPSVRIFNVRVPMYSWDSGGAWDEPKWYARVSAQIFNDLDDFHFLAKMLRCN